MCINQWASAGQQQSLICDVSERVCVFCVICIGCSTWIGIFRIDRQWPFLLAYWLVSPRKHCKSEWRKKRWILFIDFAVTCGHVVLTLTHGWAHTSCTLQKPFNSIRFRRYSKRIFFVASLPCAEENVHGRPMPMTCDFVFSSFSIRLIFDSTAFFLRPPSLFCACYVCVYLT